MLALYRITPPSSSLLPLQCPVLVLLTSPSGRNSPASSHKPMGQEEGDAGGQGQHGPSRGRAGYDKTGASSASGEGQEGCHQPRQGN